MIKPLDVKKVHLYGGLSKIKNKLHDKLQTAKIFSKCIIRSVSYLLTFQKNIFYLLQ